MKSLSRDAIQRMIGDHSGGGTGGGGVGLSSMAGFATEVWVSQNYLSIEFFTKLFKAYDSNSNEIVPNDIDSSVDNIKAMFGFWTEQYLDALGHNSGGGGGGSTTLAGLLDVAITNPQNGDALIYNATSGKWENQTIGGGGGGTLTSIGLVMPTGFSVSPATLTADGSFNVAFAAGYGLPLTSDVTKGVTAYGWGDHALAGYLTGINATMINNALGFTLMGTASTIYDLSTISTYANHGETAYGWGNHADAGYMAGNTSFWGQSVNNGVVSGSLSSVENITMSGDMKMSSGKHIYFKSGNSYLNAFEFDGTQIAVGYGFRTAADTQIYGKNVVLFANGSEIVRVTANGLQIGDALLSWDATNKVLNLTNVTSGQVATFGASGGVVSLQ